MAGQTSGGRDGAPIIQQMRMEHPKGLLDALAELEHFYSQELGGAKIDKGFFTTRDQVHWLELGFRSAFVSLLVISIFVPIANSVHDGMIPVFGSCKPSFFDQIFVYLLALSFLIGYSLFLARATRSFYGEYSHQMVNNLVGGIIAGAVFTAGVACLFYNFLSVKVLTEENIAKAMAWMAKGISVGKLEGAYRWLLEF